MTRLKVILAALAFLAFSAPAIAHPHIVIDAKAQLLFDAEGRFTGIRHDWTFDEAFSSWSVQGLDANSDGVTTGEEIDALAKEHLRSLAEYSFYTHASEEATTLVFADGREPMLRFDNGRTTLGFEVALDQPYRIADTLEIRISDPEYNAAITFAGRAAVSAEDLPAGCTVSFDPPVEIPSELAAQLAAVPADQQLPAELAAALSGMQGAIFVRCDRAEDQSDVVVADAETPPETPAAAPGEPGTLTPSPRTGFLGWVADRHAAFRTGLAETLAWIRTGANGFWFFGTLSLLYGILHAAGPAHLRSVSVSRALAETGSRGQGLLVTFLSAMLQSAVAVGLAVIAAAGLALVPVEWRETGSYGLLALLGLWLVLRKLIRFDRDQRRDHQRARAHLYGDDHTHDERLAEPGDDGAEDSERPDRGTISSAAEKPGWRAPLAVGLRPCSGALVVLVLATSQGLLPAGIAAAFLLGLGTFITVAIRGSVAAGARSPAGDLAGADPSLSGRIVWWLELLAAIVVFAFGVVLVLASF